MSSTIITSNSEHYRRMLEALPDGYVFFGQGPVSLKPRRGAENTPAANVWRELCKSAYCYDPETTVLNGLRVKSGCSDVLWWDRAHQKAWFGHYGYTNLSGRNVQFAFRRGSKISEVVGRYFDCPDLLLTTNSDLLREEEF